MKHIYKNLMIWIVSLFGMSLTAQTVADKHKAMLPQSGKLQWEKPVKAMIKPQMPVIRTPHDRMHFPITSHSASLRAATAQAMLLDSIIYCSPEGENQSKYVYQYNAQGKAIEVLGYKWDNFSWKNNSLNQYEYDIKGNCVLVSYSTFNGSEWELYEKDDYTFDEANNRTSVTYNYYNQGIISSVSHHEFDKEGRQIHMESKYVDNNGEWYSSGYFNYGYDSKDRQILYEDYRLDNGVLYLEEGRYYEYDTQDRQIYYENKSWNGGAYERTMYKYVYDVDGMIIYSENLQDDVELYRHSIEEYSYADDKLSGISSYRDTTIWKDGSGEFTSMSSWDYIYNSKGQELSMTGYDVNPENGERTDKTYTTDWTYDSQDRIETIINIYYKDEKVTSSYKTEYVYPNEGQSYVQSSFELNLKTTEWTLTSKQQYEYENTGKNSYYYRYSDWDMTSEKWIVTRGYKYEYEGVDTNFTEIEYNWNTDINDWEITYGYKYINEVDGENFTRLSAYYILEEANWYISFSDKLEIMGGSPKIGKKYSLQGDDLEDWQLYSILYYYYSESSVANESIDAVNARIYTRPGTIHVDMEGKASLSVYAANGACCYQSSISGSTDVSNLQRGIYFVVLQSDSGTKKVKVLVK